MTIDENLKLCSDYRGTVLSECINLEKWVEMFIAIYYTGGGDKGKEFLQFILDRLQFDAKISIFELLLKKIIDDENHYEKTKSKLLSEIRYIKDQRNKFAHYHHEPCEEKKVVLYSFRNKVDTHEYTKGTYQLLMKRLQRCIDEVRAMIVLEGDEGYESGSPSL